MDDLKQPLIKESTDVSTPEITVSAVDENDTAANNEYVRERDSSFIEIKNAPRTSSLPVVKVDMRDGRPRYVSLPSVRSSLPSPRQSVVVAGEDQFILEEPDSSDDEADGSKGSSKGRTIDGRHSSNVSAKSFINIHVCLFLKSF